MQPSEHTPLSHDTPVRTEHATVEALTPEQFLGRDWKNTYYRTTPPESNHKIEQVTKDSGETYLTYTTRFTTATYDLTNHRMSDKKDYELTFAPQEYGITNPVLGHLLFTLYKVGAIPIKSLCLLLEKHKGVEGTGPKNLSQLLFIVDPRQITIIPSGGQLTRVNQAATAAASDDIPFSPDISGVSLDTLTHMYISMADQNASPDTAIASIDLWADWYMTSRGVVTNYAEMIAQNYGVSILMRIANKANILSPEVLDSLNKADNTNEMKMNQLIDHLRQHVLLQMGYHNSMIFVNYYTNTLYRSAIENWLREDQISLADGIDQAIRTLQIRYETFLRSLPLENNTFTQPGLWDEPAPSFKELVYSEILSGVLFIIYQTEGIGNFPRRDTIPTMLDTSGLFNRGRRTDPDGRLLSPGLYAKVKQKLDYLHGLMNCPAFTHRVWAPISDTH